ncbi:MAG TPA: hypothetical protein VGY55_14880 [Pirellulales bacterium]|jgi:hypothetical protein|nr:hypothetical protein [Pirellulales bacterium]
MLKNNLDKKHSRWVAPRFKPQALKGRRSVGRLSVGENRRGQGKTSAIKALSLFQGFAGVITS